MSETFASLAVKLLPLVVAGLAALLARERRRRAVAREDDLRDYEPIEPGGRDRIGSVADRAAKWPKGALATLGVVLLVLLTTVGLDDREIGWIAIAVIALMAVVAAQIVARGRETRSGP